MDAITLIEKAILSWRNNKGVGTAIVPHPLNDKVLLLELLERLYSNNRKPTTTILVNNFNDRNDVIEYLTKQSCEENNDEFKNLISSKTIKILSIDFVAKLDNFVIDPILIVYRPNSLPDRILDILTKSKFKLIILNKLTLNNEELTKLYKISPLLDEFKQHEVDIARTSLPVEETLIEITIPEDSNAYRELQKYNEYISTSMAIFGNFAIIQQARLGDLTNNISAMQVCANLAHNNGWSPTLDMSVEFNRQIDALYNPGNIKDRATQTYDFIHKRGQFVANYESKLDAIYNIVSKHKDKKILIISKYSEFATKIADYINTFAEQTICAPYHDNLIPIPALDDNGNPVCYKTGKQAGKAKMLAYQAQKTQNQNKFNDGSINVISVTNTPDKTLSLNIDIVIMTSPLCREIKDYLYRLGNITWSLPLSLYTVYCSKTIEHVALNKRVLTTNHIILNNTQNDVDLNNLTDFAVVD